MHFFTFVFFFLMTLAANTQDLVFNTDFHIVTLNPGHISLDGKLLIGLADIDPRCPVCSFAWGHCTTTKRPILAPHDAFHFSKWIPLCQLHRFLLVHMRGDFTRQATRCSLPQSEEMQTERI